MGVPFHRWVQRILRDGRPRKRVRFTVNATDFPLFEASGPTLELTQPPTQRARGRFPPVVTRLRREAEHPSPSAEVQNTWSSFFTPPYI